MKKVSPLCFLLILIMFASCNNQRPPKDNGIISAQLNALLEQKEYFQLRTQWELKRDSIGEQQQLYFQAFINNAFNKNKQAIKMADSLLQYYSSGLSDSLKAALYLLKDDSYFKLFQYAETCRMDSIILNRYKSALDSEKLSDVRNSSLLHRALKNVLPQQTIIKDTTVIHWQKNKIGLMEIPLKCNGKMYDGIFDTRANISSISKTYAVKLGLKMLNVSYKEGSGITGIGFKTSLGVADSIYIGNILIRNVVFQVMPDSVLYIAPIKFSMNVIIGLPVIAQLKEIHIYQDGRMMIPFISSKSDLHNLALDGLDLFIELKTDSSALPFYFDSGAGGTSVFYYNYFKKYKEKILKQGHLKVTHFGGAGGITKKDVYALSTVHLSLANKNITLDSVYVLTQKIFPSEKFYGNIGQDFISQFNEITLNFDQMYIEGK